MSPSSRYAAGFTLAVFACSTLTAPAASPTMVAVAGMDGRVPTTEGDHALMVALVPLAKRLGMAVKMHGASVDVQVDGSWISVTPGDMLVRDERAPMMTLSTVPIQKHGTLYVNATDAAMLLDADASVEGKKLVVGRRAAMVASEGFTVRELPTPTPRPTPTAIPQSIAYTNHQAPPPGKQLIGTANLQVNSSVMDRSYNAMFDGGTANVHADLYASGVPGSRMGIGGTLRVGSGTKHATLGGVTDPLYGNVFSFGGGNGFELQNASGDLVTWSESPLNNRHVFAFGRRTAAYNAEAAFVSQFGSVPQILLGLQRSNATQHGLWDRELWIGEHGLAGGLHYRTDGRLYEEARIGFAGAGLPLEPGDAPTQLTVGYDLFKGLGLRAGYGDGRGERGNLLAQIYGRIGVANVSFSRFGNQSSISAGTATAAFSGSLNYYQAPDMSGLNSQLAFAMPRGFLTADTYLGTFGTRDMLFDYHLKRATPSMSVGLESLSSGGGSRIGPTIGYTAPVTSALALGVELHPLLHGNGLRFSVQQSVYHNLPGPVMKFVTVGAAETTNSPLYLVIDGARDRIVTGNAIRVAIADGSHYISMETADGTLGSPETRVVDGTPNTITLPLWPVVHVKGVVKLPHADLPQGPRSGNAGGITVVLQPGNIVAQTDENGGFDFAPQAMDPNATISVDDSTLPSAFAAPPAQKVPAGGNVTIVLKPSKKIQKIIF